MNQLNQSPIYTSGAAAMDGFAFSISPLLRYSIFCVFWCLFFPFLLRNYNVSKNCDTHHSNSLFLFLKFHSIFFSKIFLSMLVNCFEIISL